MVFTVSLLSQGGFSAEQSISNVESSVYSYNLQSSSGLTNMIYLVFYHKVPIGNGTIVAIL